jgi:hypothetical protein
MSINTRPPHTAFLVTDWVRHATGVAVRHPTIQEIINREVDPYYDPSWIVRTEHCGITHERFDPENPAKQPFIYVNAQTPDNIHAYTRNGLMRRLMLPTPEATVDPESGSSWGTQYHGKLLPVYPRPIVVNRPPLPAPAFHVREPTDARDHFLATLSLTNLSALMAELFQRTERKCTRDINNRAFRQLSATISNSSVRFMEAIEEIFQQRYRRLIGPDFTDRDLKILRDFLRPGPRTFEDLGPLRDQVNGEHLNILMDEFEGARVQRFTAFLRPIDFDRISILVRNDPAAGPLIVRELLGVRPLDILSEIDDRIIAALRDFIMTPTGP